MADELEEKVTRHGIHKFCDRCHKRKDTKKIGEKHLCISCANSQPEFNRKIVYVNQFKCWCGNIEDVVKASFCRTCGAMLCGKCGDYCIDHMTKLEK